MGRHGVCEYTIFADLLVLDTLQPKGAAKSRQADHMAASLPDEQLWFWMAEGSAGAKTDRQQRKGATAGLSFMLTTISLLRSHLPF